MTFAACAAQTRSSSVARSTSAASARHASGSPQRSTGSPAGTEHADRGVRARRWTRSSKCLRRRNGVAWRARRWRSPKRCAGPRARVEAGLVAGDPRQGVAVDGAVVEHDAASTSWRPRAEVRGRVQRDGHLGARRRRPGGPSNCAPGRAAAARRPKPGTRSAEGRVTEARAARPWRARGEQQTSRLRRPALPRRLRIVIGALTRSRCGTGTRNADRRRSRRSKATLEERTAAHRCRHRGVDRARGAAAAAEEARAPSDACPVPRRRTRRPRFSSAATRRKPRCAARGVQDLAEAFRARPAPARWSRLSAPRRSSKRSPNALRSHDQILE